MGVIKFLEKIIDCFTSNCPNCKTKLTETVDSQNTVYLDCDVCKYHYEYNDSYP